MLTFVKLLDLQYSTMAPLQPSLFAQLIKTSRKLVPAHCSKKMPESRIVEEMVLLLAVRGQCRCCWSAAIRCCCCCCFCCCCCYCKGCFCSCGGTRNLWSVCRSHAEQARLPYIRLCKNGAWVLYATRWDAMTSGKATCRHRRME